jgi:Yip1 domain
MTQPSGTGTEAGTPALSFPQRVVGMLFSPRATFESVVAHPKWLDMLVATILVGWIAFSAFLFSPVGAQAFKDQMIAQGEQRVAAQGGDTKQVAENIERMFPIIRTFTAIAPPIIGPIFVAVVSGLLYGLFAAMLGGGGSYKQVFAVVTHAGVVAQIGQLIVLALNYVRGTMTSATNLGVFATMLPEDSFVFKLLSSIDLVWLWYLVILAMGLAVLYRRRTATIATSFLSLYVVVAVIIAFFKRGA